MGDNNVISYEEYQEFKKYQKRNQEEIDNERRGAAVAAFSLAMVSAVALFIAIFYAWILVFVSPITAIMALAYAKKARGVKGQPHQAFVGVAIPFAVVSLVVSLMIGLALLIAFIIGLTLTILSTLVSLIVVVITVLPRLLNAISTIISVTSSLLLL